MKELIEVICAPLAMVIVGVLVWYALSKGIDSAIFLAGATIIGGLGGYELKSYLAKK